MSEETIYKELCTSYRAIDDFRRALLGFLPLASGGIIALLKEGGVAVAGSPANGNSLAPFIGVFGVVVTLGLFVFEIYGIRKCTALIFAGADLERRLGKGAGQFTLRPPGVLGVIAEPLAAGIIYPGVMAAWTYFALHFSGYPDPWWWMAGVFFVPFLLMLWLTHWLACEEEKNLSQRLVSNRGTTSNLSSGQNQGSTGNP